MSGIVAVIADRETPLLIHVLGAMVLVGGLLTVVTALALAEATAPCSRLPASRSALRSSSSFRRSW